MTVKIVSHVAGKLLAESLAAAKKVGHSEADADIAAATAVLENAIAVVTPYLHALPADHKMKDTHEPVVVIVD